MALLNSAWKDDAGTPRWLTLLRSSLRLGTRRWLGGARWPEVWPWAVLFLVLGVQWACIQRNIAATGSYPLHTDQRYLVGPAARMLESGSLNPRRFNYPSAPIYLTAASMAVGLLSEQDEAKRDKPLEVDDLGAVHVPYVEHPKVVNTARKLFGLLSVLGMGLVGWLGSRLYGRHLLWAAPLVLLLTQLYPSLSWRYLNVDILAAFGVTATLATLIVARDRPGFTDRVLIPSLCAGFAVACKYTMVVTLLPLLLGIASFEGPHKLRRSIASVALVSLTFVALCPFAILDLPRFLDGVGYEVWHYAVKGHEGYTSAAGLPQLWWYTREFAKEFTWPGLLLVLIGIARGLRLQPRATLVCLSFVVGLLWLLAGQIVHFQRNVVGAMGLLSIWLCLGAGWVFSLSIVVASRFRWYRDLPSSRQRWIRWGWAVVAVTALVWGPPLQRARARTQVATDTREAFVDWARQHLRGKVLHVPKELPLDKRRLREELEVHRYSVDARRGKGVRAVAQRLGEYALVPKWQNKRRTRAMQQLCGETIRHFDGKRVDEVLTINPELDVIRIGRCPKARSKPKSIAKPSHAR